MSSIIKKRITVNILVLVAIIFPMIGTIIPFTAGLPFNFINYSLLLLIVVIIAGSISQPSGDILNEDISPLFWFNVVIAIILLVKGVIVGLFAFAIAKSNGILFSILLIILFNKYKFKTENYLTLTKFLAFFFFFQYGISIIESYVNYNFGDYYVKTWQLGQLVVPTSPIGMRDPLLLFGITQHELLGINFPIMGLLGQHNAFGVMLIFYNLLFLYAFHLSQKKIFLFAVVLTFAAIISNTTRSSLFLMIVQDTAFLYFIYLKNKSLKIIIVFIGVILSLVFEADLFNQVFGLYANADTIAARISIWDTMINILSSQFTPLTFLLGLSLSNFGDFLTGLDRFSMGSVENQYIYFLMYTGLVGLFSFFYFFWRQFIKVKKSNSREEIIFLVLLFISIFFDSFFMDNLLQFYSYSLITILLLWILSQNERVTISKKNSNLFHKNNNTKPI